MSEEHFCIWNLFSLNHFKNLRSNLLCTCSTRRRGATCLFILPCNKLLSIYDAIGKRVDGSHRETILTSSRFLFQSHRESQAHDVIKRVLEVHWSTIVSNVTKRIRHTILPFDQVPEFELAFRLHSSSKERLMILKLRVWFVKGPLLLHQGRLGFAIIYVVFR